MKLLFFIVTGIVFLFVVPKSAFALIFLPAVVLIPIAQIVAVIIGGFSLPAVGIGVVYHKLFGKPVGKAIGIILLVVLLIALSIGVYLKFENPARPLF